MSLVRFDGEDAALPYRLFSGLAADRLAHGYLFTGPAGVGKRRFARLLAQSLLCDAPRTGVLGYDDTCTGCRLLASGTHPDLLVHDGELRIGESGGSASDELTARELMRALSRRGYSGARRILILGDVRFATHHAANALLKFFEEPPQGVHLILTTSRPGRLLETIRSRMIEVPFAPLSADLIARIMMQDGVAEADARRVAAVAEGSVTRARSLLVPGGLREVVLTWLKATCSGATVDAEWATRATLDEGLELLSLIVRDAAVRGVAEAPSLRLSGLADAELAALLPTTQDALRLYDAVRESQRLATTNLPPHLVVEGLRLAWC